MTEEKRADMLNEIQSIAKKYGFVVTNCADNGYLFEVIMVRPEKLKIHEVEHTQEVNL